MGEYETNFDKCDCNVVHEDIVKKARGNMLEEKISYDLSEVFKMFADMTRIKIINALLSSEMCVCDIAVLLNMTQPAISYQLKVLRQSRLVKYRKEGKIVFYSLDDDHVKTIFEHGLSHVLQK